MTEAADPLLTVEDLRTYLATGQGVVRAVDGVSFTLGQAEVLGIVGESGCGKTRHLPHDHGPDTAPDRLQQRPGDVPPAAARATSWICPSANCRSCAARTWR